MKPIQTYYSNGKLLLTGEYLVLSGAKALAIPTSRGQYLKLLPNDTPTISWKSLDEKGAIWFQYDFKLPLENKPPTHNIASTLYLILRQAQRQNPHFLRANQGFKVQTKLDFPRDWGLGSSSTLLNNIAQWARVDAFQLLQNTLGGSGYDIACAQHNTPIFYRLENQNPVITPINFAPVFKEQIYFVHLNNKQQSHKEVVRFQAINKDYSTEIQAVNDMTTLLAKCTSIDDFEKLLFEHERIIASVLRRKPVQQKLFNDYFGQIKSLGAWGGDFIIATGNDDTPGYFRKKGYYTVLFYNEMIRR